MRKPNSIIVLWYIFQQSGKKKILGDKADFELEMITQYLQLICQLYTLLYCILSTNQRFRSKYNF